MEIRVGHVIVDSAFAGDKIFNRFTDAASREESLISIEAIVNAFTFLYRQPAGVGQLRLTSERHAKSGERGMPALNSLVGNIEIRRGVFGVAIPAQIPAKRMAAVSLCLYFQYVATVFRRNPESNQRLKLLLLL